MSTIWILVLVIIGADGQVRTQLNFPQKAEFNSKANCNESGDVIANKLQLEIGTSNGKVFYYCDGVPRSEITKSLAGV